MILYTIPIIVVINIVITIIRAFFKYNLLLLWLPSYWHHHLIVWQIVLVGYFPDASDPSLEVFKEAAWTMALHTPDVQVKCGYTDAILLGNWMHLQPGEVKIFYTMADSEVWFPSMSAISDSRYGLKTWSETSCFHHDCCSSLNMISSCSTLMLLDNQIISITKS